MTPLTTPQATTSPAHLSPSARSTIDCDVFLRASTSFRRTISTSTYHFTISYLTFVGITSSGRGNSGFVFSILRPTIDLESLDRREPWGGVFFTSGNDSQQHNNMVISQQPSDFDIDMRQDPYSTDNNSSQYSNTGHSISSETLQYSQAGSQQREANPQTVAPSKHSTSFSNAPPATNNVGSSSSSRPSLGLRTQGETTRSSGPGATATWLR